VDGTVRVDRPISPTVLAYKAEKCADPSLFLDSRVILERDEEGYMFASKWLITWKEDGFRKRFLP